MHGIGKRKRAIIVHRSTDGEYSTVPTAPRPGDEHDELDPEPVPDRIDIEPLEVNGEATLPERSPTRRPPGHALNQPAERRGPRPVGRPRNDPRRHLLRPGLSRRCVTRASAASGRAISPVGRHLWQGRRRPSHGGLLQLPRRDGGEGRTGMLGGGRPADAVPGAGHRRGRGAERRLQRRGAVGPRGCLAAAPPRRRGRRRRRADDRRRPIVGSGRRSPPPSGPAGWPRRGRPARRCESTAATGTSLARDARDRRHRGPPVGGGHESRAGRDLAGQPGLERGRLGRRNGELGGPRAAARRRARHRHRPHPARRGRGADGPAGGARLRRARRRRAGRPARGAAACARDVVASGVLPFPNPMGLPKAT